MSSSFLFSYSFFFSAVLCASASSAFNSSPESRRLHGSWRIRRRREKLGDPRLYFAVTPMPEERKPPQILLRSIRNRPRKACTP